MPNTRRRQSSLRMSQTSPRRKRTTSERIKRTTSDRIKRKSSRRIKNRTTSQRRRKSSSMKNNAEFNLFEYLINVDLNTEKVKTYLNNKITDKHPLFKLKKFMMKPKKNTQVYLKECIKLFIESHQKFLNSFDIEKSLKNDKKAVKIITSAIKQRLKIFKSEGRNMSGGNDTETCVICLEQIDNSSDNPDSTSQKLFGDDCTHYQNFHKNCINDWVMTAERTTTQQGSCPLCKREIQDEFRRTIINQDFNQPELQEEHIRRERRIDTVVRNERRRLRREGLDYLLCSILCFIFINSQIQRMSDRRGGFDLGTIQDREERFQEYDRLHDEISQQLEREANMSTLDVTLSRLSLMINPNQLQFNLLMLMFFYAVVMLIRMPILGIIDIYRSYTLTFDWGNDNMIDQYEDLVFEENDALEDVQNIMQEQGDMFFDNEFPEGGI